MAKTFLTNINLKGNQLLNAVIHSASSAPSALAAGQLYFNTADRLFYYSLGTGTGSWQPVGVQYITSVGSNLSVTDDELNISTDPSFNTIHLTQDGQGENILVGNDAYIGDINVSNFLGIKGNEDATKGGIKFGSAKTETISTDGSNLTLTADNDIVLLPGSDYAYIGTPLIDGSNRIATLGDITGDLTGFVTETGVETLTNKTIGDKLNFTGYTSPTDGYIWSNTNNGELEIYSEYDIQLSPDGIVNIGNGDGELHLQKTEYWRNGTQQGVIAAQPDGSLKLTGTNNGLQLEANNGNITLTPPGISRVILNGNTDANNNLRVSNELTVGGWDNVDGLVSVQNADGVNMLVVDTAASPMDQYHGNNTYTNATGVVNLNAFLNISSEGNVPSGYLFMNVSGASTNPTLHLESKGDLALRAGADGNDGNIILYTGQTSSGQAGKAYIGWNHDNGGNYNNQIATLGDVSTAQSEAESYADNVASQAQSTAESYADNVASQAQSAAESYAANVASQAQSAAEGYTDTAVANLVGMAPALLDTLEKIDNAIANDANFSTTLLNDIANAVSNAESYADGVAGQAQSAAESYADNVASQAQSAAESYASEIVGNLNLAGGKYVGTITGGVDTAPYTFNHNFGTNDVVVRVYQTSAGVDQYADVEVDVKRSSNGNSVTIGFAVAPATGENYSVVIVG